MCTAGRNKGGQTRHNSNKEKRTIFMDKGKFNTVAQSFITLWLYRSYYTGQRVIYFGKHRLIWVYMKLSALWQINNLSKSLGNIRTHSSHLIPICVRTIQYGAAFYSPPPPPHPWTWYMSQLQLYRRMLPPLPVCEWCAHPDKLMSVWICRI